MARVALLALLLALLGGCEDFADTVLCSPPQVLNDQDDCVDLPGSGSGGSDAGMPSADAGG